MLAGLPPLEGDALTLMAALCGSTVVSLALLVLWCTLIAPAVPAYRARSRDEQLQLNASFVSLFPSVTAPALAALAIFRLPACDDVHVLEAAPSQASQTAHGSNSCLAPICR